MILNNKTSKLFSESEIQIIIRQNLIYFSLLKFKFGI